MRFSRWHDKKSLTYVKFFKTLIIYAQSETVVTRLNVYLMLASYFLTFLPLLKWWSLLQYGSLVFMEKKQVHML